MNKSRSIFAKILNIVLVCFIALSIVIIVPACNKVPTSSHTQHSYVYTAVDNENHKKTCSNCTEVDETEAHSYDDAQDYTCNDCGYVRAPSNIKLSVDKTELSAGETFTLKVVISTLRTDMFWRAIDFNVGPLLDDTTVAPDIAKYFEVVDFTLDNVKFRNRTMYLPLTTDLFNSQQNTAAFRISYAFIGADETRAISTAEDFELTAIIKVKEDAPAVQSFMFGSQKVAFNMVNFGTANTSNDVTDAADERTSGDTSESVGLSINTITMSIK